MSDKSGKIARCAILILFITAILLTGCGQHAMPSGQEEQGENTVEQPGTKEDERPAGEILEELMADEGFRTRVWYSAGIEKEDTREIVEQKIEQCENLVLKNEDIYSLEDLRFLPNLKGLVIDYGEMAYSQIEDFTPIADLQKLERLYIKYPAKKDMDLSFLTQMDTVTELFLVNCDLKDVSFLEKMPQLRCLSLYQTPIDDLAVLENLTELVELALYGNAEAAHIESVGRLRNMQHLELQDCGISDIHFLSGLTELRSVNLNDNSVADLTPLAGLLKLEQVGLSNNRIRDFSPLADKPELLYAAVYGNPCTDLEPVWQVPLLYFSGGNASEEQLRIVKNWMEKQRPDVEEYRCIDYSETDLNGDGLQDAAFVVRGEFGDGGGIYASNNERRMFVLLRQEDGSWREAENNIHIRDSDSGGMRGDPYQGMWSGDGHVLIQQGWGSGSGTTQTEIYCCRQGSLELERTVDVDDYNWAYGYDVTVHNMADGTWNHYAIAMDGYRMVRVDLENNEYPAHRAFPRLDLFDASYYTYPEGLPLNMDAVAALECFLQYVQAEMVQEPLPYAEWQKKGYELLKGVKLPDYYYVSPGAEEENGVPMDCIYYLNLELDNGTYYHVICYERDGRTRDYRINDTTGELEDVEG